LKKYDLHLMFIKTDHYIRGRNKMPEKPKLEDLIPEYLDGDKRQSHWILLHDKVQ